MQISAFTMSRSCVTKLGRTLGRGLRDRTAFRGLSNRPWKPMQASLPAYEVLHSSRRPLCTSPALSRPLPAEVRETAQPADITGEQYHKLADEYIENLLVKYEEEQDAKGEIDVEYSVSVPSLRDVPFSTC